MSTEPTFSKLLRSIENKKIDSTKYTKKFEKSVESLTQTSPMFLENWNKTAPLPPLPKFLLVRILHDLEEFVDADGNVYQCKRDDVITMPEQNANILIAKKAAVLVNSPSAGRRMQ